MIIHGKIIAQGNPGTFGKSASMATQLNLGRNRDAPKCQECYIQATRPDHPIIAGLTGQRIRTLDDSLRVFQNHDLNSDVIRQIPQGLEIQLGAATEIDGREWIEANLPDGAVGYVLGSSVRSHTAVVKIEPQQQNQFQLNQPHGEAPGPQSRGRMAYGEALRVAWFLFWRSYLVSVFWNFDSGKLLGKAVRSYLHNLWVALPVLLSALTLLTIVVLWLFRWFIHQLLRKKFRGFRVIAYCVGESHPIHHLSLWDAFKVWWLLTWRWWLVAIATGSIIGGIYGLFFVMPGGSQVGFPAELHDLTVWIICLQGIFLALPWAVRRLVSNPPWGFRIDIDTATESAVVANGVR